MTKLLTLKSNDFLSKTSFFLSSLSTSTGTSVLESIYDPSIENITDIASGIKRYFVAPSIKNIGAKTVHIESVDTKVGVATSAVDL